MQEIKNDPATDTDVNIKSPKIIGRLKSDKQKSEIIIISPKHIILKNNEYIKDVDEASASITESDSNCDSANEDADEKVDHELGAEGLE